MGVFGCIKDKQNTKKWATRSANTDICDPFDISSFARENYFITFIYDFSRYGYIYLLHDKSQ